MKFIDFGKQLAKPVKFIKQNTAFLPKPIQQAVVFAVIFAGLPLFLVGFIFLRILNGTPVEDISTTNEIEYNLNNIENTVSEIEDDSEVSKPEDLWDVIAYQDENQVDGYRNGDYGYGLYVGGYFFPTDENGDLEI
ncbi:hypothetical protein [Mannheimia haemolytica]|uniref:hypothetical protein n=1 Tax=Mannheimia haemolytica TaxID=75985 RepID=UPI001ADBB93A|nr:hypothetical protein [Mannheimia haemolytica]